MLVRFKRNWFGPDGVRYKTRDGLAEVGDDLRDQLPKDAEVISETATLPSKGLVPIAGFGAIPEHEQRLADLGAAPTHLITGGAGEGQNPVKGDFLDDGAAHEEFLGKKDDLAAEEKAEDEATAKAAAFNRPFNPPAATTVETVVDGKKSTKKIDL